MKSSTNPMRLTEQNAREALTIADDAVSTEEYNYQYLLNILVHAIYNLPPQDLINLDPMTAHNSPYNTDTHTNTEQ